MAIEERMDKIGRAFGAQDDLVLELRDAVTVTAELEALQGRILKEHRAWLVEQEPMLAKYRASQEQDRAEWEARMKKLDEDIANLLRGFGEYMRRERN